MTHSENCCNECAEILDRADATFRQISELLAKVTDKDIARVKPFLGLLGLKK